MTTSRDVLIALAAGARLTTAVGFDLVGRELAQIRVPHANSDGLAYDPMAAWQAARTALRGLADRVPDLARRAVGLAVTGTEGGLVAVDEDGDPLAVAIAPGACRSLPHGAQETAIVGPLACLIDRHPAVLDQAAWLLPAKDWVHFCLTGAARLEPLGAELGLGPPGSWEPPGLADLMPEPPGAAVEPDTVARAAAGACRLCQGLPAVLAPPAGVGAAIAGGALETGPEVGFALLEDTACYLLRPPEDRAKGDRATPSCGAGTSVDLPCGGGPARIVVGAPAGAGLAWLLDLLQDVLGEIGLIGTGDGELKALLLRRAEAAAPARLIFEATDGVGRLTGVAGTTSIGDLARAALEGVGLSGRRILTELGGLPAELRVAGGLVADPLARTLFAAAVDRPVRRCRRDDAATAGAALLAALKLGIVNSAETAGRDWVAPYLTEPELADPELAARYACSFDARPAAS